MSVSLSVFVSVSVSLCFSLFLSALCLGGVRLHTSFLGCSCHWNPYLQDNKKTFSHPERLFGSKIKFLVLSMKLPNSRSFAIIGEENKRGLVLEDNTSVNVLVNRCNGMWG